MNQATHTPAISHLAPFGRWPDDVNVWHVDVPEAVTDWPPLERQLSDDERLRAARYLRNEDRLRFAVTRASLRALLAAYTGERAEALRFSFGPNGKPALDGHPQAAFNVTHSGQHALIAISAARRVGIDVQVVDPALRWPELLDLVCTADERRMLVTSPEPAQLPMFFRCWTGKEALLKATGAGIAEGLQRVSLDFLSPGAQRLSDPMNQHACAAAVFQLHWLSEVAGCTACIAFEV
jgi:4'-phosphopantetheinyl transferase